MHSIEFPLTNPPQPDLYQQISFKLLLFKLKQFKLLKFELNELDIAVVRGREGGEIHTTKLQLIIYLIL